MIDREAAHLLRLIPVPLLVVDNTGKIVFSNQLLCELLEQDKSMLIGQPLTSLTTDSAEKTSNTLNLFFGSADFMISNMTLRKLNGDQALIEAFSRDQDVHCLSASLIYNLPESKVQPQMREVAKRVNFGIIYGQSAYGLSRDLDIPINQAQDFIDAYFLRYPKVRDFIDAQINKARTEGFVTTLMGRRRYIPEINSKNMGIRQFAERQAVNTPIQGTASDLIKLAMVKISEQINHSGLKSKMILQIHDELVFDLPVAELKTLTKLVKERMEEVKKLDVPIKIDMKKGKNWLDMEAVE